MNKKEILKIFFKTALVYTAVFYLTMFSIVIAGLGFFDYAKEWARCTSVVFFPSLIIYFICDSLGISMNSIVLQVLNILLYSIFITGIVVFWKNRKSKKDIERKKLHRELLSSKEDL